MWCNKYDVCVKCSLNDSPHASRGMCRRCYQRGYASEYNKHNAQRVREIRKKYKEKYLFDEHFSEIPCTLKKLTYLVAQKLFGNQSKRITDKIERAKNFIRNKLPEDLKPLYLSEWDNDFKTMRDVLGIECQEAIIKAVYSNPNRNIIGNLKTSSRAKNISHFLELEFALQKPVDEILRNWHRDQRMSSQEISDKLKKEFEIIISRESVCNWLEKIGILRNHVMALRNRVVTGRMSYKALKSGIKGTYKSTRRRTRHVLIRVNKPVKEEIKRISQISNRTMSEVIRDVFKFSHENIVNPSRSRSVILSEGILKYKEQLESGRLKTQRGIHVVAAISNDKGTG